MVRLGESPSPLLATLRLLVPALTAERYKGQAGKIAVVGGCADYTGAPYYAAISALKLGADLSHVFCSDAAATAIKSYSPELIVHGCLKERQPDAAAREAQVEAVCDWFPAITALVVGPGLGRDETLQAVAEGIIKRAIAESIPCVIDADGLAVVVRKPALVQGSRWTVLTPNRPEYQRLSQAVIPQVAAAEPGKQAETVYRVYTGNNPDNGCMSGWCQGSGCAEPHWAFGQDNNTMETHRFCRGMWTEKPRVYEEAVEKLGGIDTIRNKCSAAASSRGLGVVGNGMRPPQTAQEQQLSDYLMQKLREIFLESAAASPEPSP